jgi:glycosyltransferase involved in cell wall biosynthesis
MKCCVIIPVFNHGSAVGAVANAVRNHGLHCILVDDGSNASCAAVLDALVLEHGSAFTLKRLSSNQGKGAAMLAGFRVAHAMGFSHALQIDADGQHDVSDIPDFIELARQYPDRLICGRPVYDASVPRVRLYGRYLTHMLVFVNTLSRAIRDSMCGFRVYPLPATIELIDHVAIAKRMDYDIDIAVRLYWSGVDVVNHDTPVTYPSDGVSHFRMARDNARITRIHAVLFLGMLSRLPQLLRRRARSPLP